MASAGVFPTTHWSEVARAGGEDPQLRHEALGRLLARYLPAFRAHVIVAWHVSVEQAEDLVQGFVCDRVLQDELIAGADRTCGKFRTYLLTALDRHVARVRRFESARKRRPVDAAVGTIAERDLPTCGMPDSFDIAWARQVIAQAIEQMRKEYSDGRRGQIWEAFELCVLGPLLEGKTPPAHAEAMSRLGLESVQQVSNTLVSGKRAFARTLHAVIGEYAAGEQEIEAELRDLWTVLSSSGSRAGHPSGE